MYYAIVDIETTGGSHGNKITEIAVCKTDGKQITDRFESLVCPGVPIPYSITLLTGINNNMVQNAPTFEEIANDLRDFLQDCIFVAHNVSFDYSIIKHHYTDMGLRFNMKKLCTVRLSKGIIPGHSSYSLGNICRALNIENHNRHRAMGDAEATAKLFHVLQDRDRNNFIEHSLKQINREAVLPPNISTEQYDQLPEKPGVYYFLGSKMEVLYVGKSKNIKQRVNTHFGEKSRRKSELLRKMHNISFKETGNELVASLLESLEIRKHYPHYNKAQKSSRASYHVCCYKGQDGILRLDIFNQKYSAMHITSFSNMVAARDFLYYTVEEYGLCPRYTGLERHKGPCFNSLNCAICCEGLSTEEYNQRVMDMNHNQIRTHLLIIGAGRVRGEKTVVQIEHGEYRGYGFFDADTVLNTRDIIDRVKRQKSDKDTLRIIREFLKSKEVNRYELIVPEEEN